MFIEIYSLVARTNSKRHITSLLSFIYQEVRLCFD